MSLFYPASEQVKQSQAKLDCGDAGKAQSTATGRIQPLRLSRLYCFSPSLIPRGGGRKFILHGPPFILLSSGSLAAASLPRPGFQIACQLLELSLLLLRELEYRLGKQTDRTLSAMFAMFGDLTTQTGANSLGAFFQAKSP